MRVVLLGDDGVGKSTLITCLFKDRYIPNIEDVLPVLFFPSQNDTTVALVDTSPSLANRNKLLTELRHANCIWLVYSDHYTMERISLFWLPFLRNNGVNLPIILCQTKQDRLFSDDGELEDISIEEEDDVIELMQDFKEIESFVRCSAKMKRNVNEAFYLCQRAILFPLAPLYDSKIGKLKPLAEQALTRVFFVNDEDQSGIMTRKKLEKLQAAVFNTLLGDEEVQLIHETLANIQTEDRGGVAQEESDQVLGLTSPLQRTEELMPINATQLPDQYWLGRSVVLYDETVDGLTLAGFLRLAQLYCERGRHETIWAILRRFHYTDSLSLDEKFLRPAFHVDSQSHVELSPDGYQFLVDLFTLFDRDNDGGLSPTETKKLFTPTPGLPALWKKVNFPYSTLRNDDGYVTLQGWLAQWSMFVFLEHSNALSYMAMLGYHQRASNPSDIKSALRVTKPAKRRNPRSRVYRQHVVPDRQVFNCYVLGSTGAGKSTLLQSFLGSRVRSNPSSTGEKYQANMSSSHLLDESNGENESLGRGRDSFSARILDTNAHEEPKLTARDEGLVNESGFRQGLSSGIERRSRTLSDTLGEGNRQRPDMPHTVVNSVEMPGGKQSYLILQEVSVSRNLEDCDVVCLTYDSSDPDSFAYLVELRAKHPELDRMPLVFAALKADQDRAQQRCDVQPDEYTGSLGISAPMHVSSNWPSSLNAFFVQLVDVAMHPGSATITLPGDEPETSLLPELTVAAVASAAVAMAWWLNYFYRRPSST